MQADKMKVAALLNWWEDMQTKKMHTGGKQPDAADLNKTIDLLLEKAIARQATDVHIEPRERRVAVRFRVDGLLQEATALPLTVLSSIVSSFKTRAGLEPAQTRTPQNASFDFKAKEFDVTVNIATMPVIGGEKVTLHMNPHFSEPATLASLGYWGKALTSIEQAVAEPHGLVVVASPDRTATSMSLLGIVHLLNSPALNVATIEDSIERQLPGVNRTQIDSDAGLNYHIGLQALLNQDPNVIMVSELRDPPTAELALRASLNGQLILGGVHADSAALGITHLLHMGVPPYLLAATLKIGTARRSVRRLCPACRQSYRPEEPELKSISHTLQTTGFGSIGTLHTLEQEAVAAGVGSTTPFSTTTNGITRLWHASPNGCSHCHYRGYTGFLGVYETLVNSDHLKNLLASSPTTATIQKLAVTEGMVPLQLDAVIKALRGLTTIEEVNRLAS